MIFRLKINAHAAPIENKTNIQEHIKVHIEKVKFSNPQKYQEMVQRAGGNITQCTDCHKEVLKGNLPTRRGMDSSGKK